MFQSVRDVIDVDQIYKVSTSTQHFRLILNTKFS